MQAVGAEVSDPWTYVVVEQLEPAGWAQIRLEQTEVVAL